MKRTSQLLVEPYLTYMSFIKQRQNMIYEDGVVLHKHHIIPRSLGGSNKKTNLIMLSVEDHITAHLMLGKCFDDGSYEQICNFRAARILNKFSIQDQETLDAIKITYIGENNPFYGKTHSDDTRKKLSEATTANRTGVLYDDFYGIERAFNEKQKRADKIKEVWSSRTEEEKLKIRGKASIKLKGRVPWNKKKVKVNDIVFDGIKEAAEYFSTTKYLLLKTYDVKYLENI